MLAQLSQEVALGKSSLSMPDAQEPLSAGRLPLTCMNREALRPAKDTQRSQAGRAPVRPLLPPGRPCLPDHYKGCGERREED